MHRRSRHVAQPASAALCDDLSASTRQHGRVACHSNGSRSAVASSWRSRMLVVTVRNLAASASGCASAVAWILRGQSSMRCQHPCCAAWRLTPPSSGRPKGRFAPFAPPLMSNVRPHSRIASELVQSVELHGSECRAVRSWLAMHRRSNRARLSSSNRQTAGHGASEASSQLLRMRVTSRFARSPSLAHLTGTRSRRRKRCNFGKITPTASRTF